MAAVVSAQRAALLLDLVRGVEPAPGSFEPDVLDRARRLLANCGEAAGATDHEGFLFLLAQNVVPYLQPAELTTVWTHLERQPCLSTPSPRERAWIDLLKAVGARDALRMAKRAEKLLEAEDELRERRHYLLAVAMLGRVAVGEPTVAYRLWTEYGREVGRGPFSLLIEVLAAPGRSGQRPAP